VWIGTTGNWLTPGNWDNGVPDGSTSATIDNGGTATLAGLAEIAQLRELRK